MWIVRQFEPGAVHHVIARFIDRDFLIPDEAARERYLTLLGRAMTGSDWRCLAFALMSSHVHLAMIGGHTPPERWLRRVHPPYAAWLNVRLGRIGPVFAASPAIWVMRADQERRLVAYLHNNPVRARVVAHARDSHWTSHRAYLGHMAYPWLDTSAGLERLGLAAHELDAFVEAEVGYAPEQATLDGIRKAARKRGALEVGTATAGSPVVAPLLARVSAYVRPEPADVVRLVGDVVGVSIARMRSRSREREVVAARVIAVHSGCALGLSITSVASVLGFSAQWGSTAAGRGLQEPERAVVSVVIARAEAAIARLWKKGKGSRLKRA